MTQAPKTWAAKDPQAVLDYLYTIPLDTGDSVASYTLTKISTDDGVTVDSDARSGANVTAWLSGGNDGKTGVFRIAWVTTLTRHDDAIILLPIAANEPVALVLTGYAKPSPAHLAIKYPVFAAVSPSTVQFWLTDAERYVTNAWSEGDYAAGLMALAAHNMALAGLGTEAEALADLPAGVSRFKSGTLDVTLTEAAANARINGGSGSTIYGAEYQMLLRKNRAGPLVASTGVAPYGYVYPDFAA
jgi:hypothetical protein